MSRRSFRVLMTTDCVGGVWTFTLELARGLAQKGVDVLLASMGRAPSETQIQDAAQIPGLVLYPGDYKLEWMEDPWDDVDRSAAWLLDLATQWQPDVVHLNTLAHGALPWPAPVVMTAHSCVTSWWAAVKGEPLPRSWSRYKATVSRSIQAVQRVIAPSHAMRACLEELYGNITLKKPIVIPNGRTAAEFRSGPKRNFILGAGRLWDEAKNTRALAAVAPELPWPVVLAGASNVRDNRCRQLGELPGDAMARCLSAASIFAHPARYEPFGLAVLEAGLSQCALVLGDIPSLRENWNEAALFVPPDDERALKEALKSLIQQPHLRQQLGQASYEKAKTFTPQRMTNEYIAVYAAAAQETIACAS